MSALDKAWNEWWTNNKWKFDPKVKASIIDGFCGGFRVRQASSEGLTAEDLGAWFKTHECEPLKIISDGRIYSNNKLIAASYQEFIRERKDEEIKPT